MIIIGLLSVNGLFHLRTNHGEDYAVVYFVISLLSIFIGAAPLWFWVAPKSGNRWLRRLDHTIGWMVPIAIALRVYLLIWTKKFNHSGEDGLYYSLVMAVLFALDFIFLIGFFIILYDCLQGRPTKDADKFRRYADPGEQSQDADSFREFLSYDPLAKYLDANEQMRRFTEWKHEIKNTNGA